jgi:hypothetical protein
VATLLRPSVISECFRRARYHHRGGALLISLQLPLAPMGVLAREGVEHPIVVTTRLSVVRLPFGFKVWRGVRHPEKDHNLPAWLALKCATILFHRLGADRAQRGHWAKGLSRQTFIPACRRNTVQICVIRNRTLILEEMDGVAVVFLRHGHPDVAPEGGDAVGGPVTLTPA